MRVISGYLKGRKLKCIEGLNIRPTTDRIKESVFNIIQFYIQDKTVLDLFAGTGSLGIEAISRGATSATFIDNDKASINILKENLNSTGILSKSIIVNSDYKSFLASKKNTFDLVFLDPPYNKNIIDDCLSLLVLNDFLNNNAKIVIECDVKDQVNIDENSFEILKNVNYGRTKIIVLNFAKGVKANASCNLPGQL